jgi:hypothetical protein
MKILKILLPILLLILSSEVGAQSISKDSILHVNFNARAIEWKGDTLICLDKRKAHIASLQLKKIPIYKQIIQDQDTVILKQKQNIQLKDSIILEDQIYIDTLERQYNHLNLHYQTKKTELKTFKKYSMYKDILLVGLLILSLL